MLCFFFSLFNSTVVAPLFAKALSRHGIPVTRLPIEVNMEPKTWLKENPQLLDLLHLFVQEAKLAVPILKENEIRLVSSYRESANFVQLFIFRKYCEISSLIQITYDI